MHYAMMAYIAMAWNIAMRVWDVDQALQLIAVEIIASLEYAHLSQIT
jgi:hypothetical protein